MLDDRDYMRRSPRGPENKVQTGMSCVYALIAINAVAFLVTMGSRQEAVYRFWLSVDGLKDGMFWQILTAMFMHGGIGHIFFNMWAYLYFIPNSVFSYCLIGTFSLLSCLLLPNYV